MARQRKGNATTNEVIVVTAVMLVVVAIAYFVLDGLAAIVLAAVAIAGFGVALGFTARRGSA